MASARAMVLFSKKNTYFSSVMITLNPATLSDLQDIAALVNGAYRGEGSKRGWTSEAAYMGGQRTDPAMLALELREKPGALLLTLRDGPEADLLGCVWLEPHGADIWHLGMLTVRPDLQRGGIGRALLAAAERAAASRGARRVTMTVINIRDRLIAWYLRRGYRATGETLPFPYGDDRFGTPLRDDLHFTVLEKTLQPDASA
jgi:ribosomal protein S18 acetylase RimI-like enzyme